MKTDSSPRTGENGGTAENFRLKKTAECGKIGKNPEKAKAWRKEPRRGGRSESRWEVRTGGPRGVFPLSEQPARSRKGGAL